MHRALLALADRARAIAADSASAKHDGETMRDALRDALQAAEREALDALHARGWSPDYLVVRRRVDLAVPDSDDLAQPESLVALGAARLGTTRLIDNVEF